MPESSLPSGIAVGAKTDARLPRKPNHAWRCGEWRYHFVETSGALVAHALEQIRAGADVATVHTGGPTSMFAIAAAFASHVHDRRPKEVCLSCVTSAARLRADHDGLISVPHFVCASEGPRLVDLPIWEFMAPEVFVSWLGGNRVDLAYFESHLGVLLKVRRMLREDALPRSRFGVELLDALEGSYLSMRFVLRHATLLRRVIEELPT